MAKLTQRQKNNIIAKWNTGVYDKTQLAKAYKVSDVMIGKIVGKEKPKNAEIVEAGIVVELAKKFNKSSAEVDAINQAVKYRLEKDYSIDNKRIKIYDLTNKLLDKVEKILDKGTKQVIVKTTSRSGIGFSDETVEVQDVDLDPNDLKNIQGTIDQASITNNTNQRHSNQNINVNTQNNVHNEVNSQIVKETLIEFENEY